MTPPSLPPCIGIIPARYDSTRFPGKPLADILGRPMFWHVYQRSRRCPLLERVVLATDDERIRTVADELDVPVVMTSPDHQSGTDRVLEAANHLQVPAGSVVVNIQGDEPALAPEMLSELLDPFTDPTVQVATLARRIDAREAADPNRVKAVFAGDGRALYFSRSVIPFARSEKLAGYWGHIGLYAFRVEALEQFVRLGPSPLEKIEQLEQLRLLEADIPIHVVPTEHHSIGVDSPDDLPPVIRLLKEQN